MTQDINPDLLAKPILEQDAFDSAFDSTFEALYYGTPATLQEITLETLNEKVSPKMFADLLEKLQRGALPLKVSDEFMNSIATDEQTQIKIVNLARSYSNDKFFGQSDEFIQNAMRGSLSSAAEWVERRYQLANVTYPKELLNNSDFKNFVKQELRMEMGQVELEHLQIAMANRLPEVRYIVYQRYKIQQELSKYEGIVKFDETDREFLSDLETSSVRPLAELERKIENFVNITLIDRKILQIKQTILDKPFVSSMEIAAGLILDGSLLNLALELHDLRPLIATFLSLPLLALGGVQAFKYIEEMGKIDKLIRSRNGWASKQWQ